ETGKNESFFGLHQQTPQFVTPGKLAEARYSDDPHRPDKGDERQQNNQNVHPVFNSVIHFVRTDGKHQDKLKSKGHPDKRLHDVQQERQVGIKKCRNLIIKLPFDNLSAQVAKVFRPTLLDSTSVKPILSASTFKCRLNFCSEMATSRGNIFSPSPA